jgi:protein-S-isoprenylcysteine O-methyltransferase Ste14
METRWQRLQRREFEARIFVSFGVVGLVLVLAYAILPQAPSLAARIGTALGADAGNAHRTGFVVAGLLLAFASALRIWAGSVLTPRRVMAFKVQHDALATRGPYRLVRNPIYAADLVAFAGFSLCLPPVGLALIPLLAAHYHQIIRHEERSLSASHGVRFEAFAGRVPRLLPGLASLHALPRALREIEVTRAGVRHNALYLLFLPGMAVAALTGDLLHAIVIGLPGTLDWAVVHTRIGLDRRTTKEEPRHA